MPSSKTPISQSTKKKSASRSTAPLKQATLGFSLTKRSSSNFSSSGKPQKSAGVLSLSRTASSIHVESEPEDDEDDLITAESLEEEQEDHADSIEVFSEEEYTPVTTTRKGRKDYEDIHTRTSQASSPHNKQDTPPLPVQNENLYSDRLPKRWLKHYGSARAKMGYLEPLHAQGQTKVHEMLRVFDMSYEYGPCVGMSRLERWERADSLGLNPPPEVREILLTKQGIEQNVFAQCVLYDEV